MLLTKSSKNYWPDIPLASIPYVLNTLDTSHFDNILIVANTVNDSKKIKHAFDFFTNYNNQHNHLLFPDRETLPYDQITPHKDITSSRMEVLSKIKTHNKNIIFTNIQNIMNFTPPLNHVLHHSINLTVNDEIVINEFLVLLQEIGYNRTEQVFEHGEFCLKGGIIDLYPMGFAYPIRIEMFDNTIESIRIFDVDTQISTKKIESINLKQAHEYPLTEEATNIFMENYKQLFNNNPKKCHVYQTIKQKLPPAGGEYYLPLFYKTPGNIFDYLSNNTLIIYQANTHEYAQQYIQHIQERYQLLQFNLERPILPPQQAFIGAEKIFEQINKYQSIIIGKKSNVFEDIWPKHIDRFTLNIHESKPFTQVKKFIDACYNKILIIADSLGRQEIINTLCYEVAINPTPINNWHEFLNTPGKVFITHANLDHGFSSNEVTLITEYEIFGIKNHVNRRYKHNNIDPDKIMKSLGEIKAGEYVVHLEYGIGIYQGIKCIENNSQQSDFVEIEYANQSKIYVPIHSLNLISKYGGFSTENIQLSNLSKNTWKKNKHHTINDIRDLAAELLHIHALRKNKKHAPLTLDEHEFNKFCIKCGFEDTFDQIQATIAVKQDMLSQHNMDRLLCGDVGFGKTEIAIRAAYIACNNNKQVAFLVPTTILAEQHYQTISDRFAGYGIHVQSISRFNSPKEKAKILSELSDGKIDIIIGTHSLLQKNITFKNIGLLVIDEEHRFGVRQKEYIQNIRKDLPILSMTATPIPRTLNMSLNGVRDISIIATPPTSRLAIKTIINEYQRPIIREAILRELHRGGQVFYVYNNVKSIHQTLDKLSELIPEAKIKVAHGQLNSKELENIMSDFYHGKFNVLICTTIIETGLDIPTANTIIIERADKLGLAQLYQLRGRVGRSHHQAYAYLLAPKKKELTKDAKLRIEALQSLHGLGAGFSLATHDLDIRGAGDILGKSQSGNIQKVGFSLYIELLNKTIKAIQNNQLDQEVIDIYKSCEINLSVSAIIPEKFIYNINERLMFYKKISIAESSHEIHAIKTEMIDRFGLLPEATTNLLDIAELSLYVTKYGAIKIDSNMEKTNITFNEKPQIQQEKLLKLITLEPKKYTIKANNSITINMMLISTTEKIAEIKRFIKSII